MKKKAEFLLKQAAELKRQREALGLSQLAVADGIGVSEPSIRVWEGGRSVMSALYAERLEDFFKTKWQEREQQAKREIRRSGASA